MSHTISSNTLCHFTTTYSNLINILRNEFIPYFSLENFDYNGIKTRLAIPMICFCDLPLSQIKDHINHYGGYGIGMQKNWGKRVGINPIWYLQKDSSVDSHIGYFLNHMNLFSIFMNNKAFSNDTQRIFYYLLFHTKEYEGYMKRTGNKLIRFYDEKEWRYIPFDLKNSELFFLSESDYKIKKILDQSNTKMQSYKLLFNPSNIKYIFISKEKERKNIIRDLRNIKSKYSSIVIDILASRIITKKQIMEDF